MPYRMSVVLFAVAILAACGGPPVVGDARGSFDTVKGVYGGNEFSPLSPEGHRTFKGDAPASEAAAATPPDSSTPPGPLAQAGVASSPPAIAQSAPIRIDANAYGAVFGAAAGPVRPTPAQLMQLDSLSLVASDALRVDLQQNILACRRAGDACRLTAH